MGGIQQNSLRRQAYRFLARNVGRTVHLDALARHLRIDLKVPRGIERARKPLYDLMKAGEIELEDVIKGSAWKVVAVIADLPDSEIVVDPKDEPVTPAEREAQAALLAANDPVAAVAALPVVPIGPQGEGTTYVQVGARESGAPVVKGPSGTLYYLTRI